MSEPTSELLMRVRDGAESERVSLGEISEGVGGRAHGLILILLGLPEAIPMIGLSAILALPILVVGAYMVTYGINPPLPRWLRDRTVDRSKLDSAIDRALPVIRGLDRISRPRWSRVAESGRLQGIVCVLMAVLLAVPVPGVNILAAFGVVGIGVGVLQRDGLIISLAFASATLALAGAAGVALGGVVLWEYVVG